MDQGKLLFRNLGLAGVDRFLGRVRDRWRHRDHDLAGVECR